MGWWKNTTNRKNLKKIPNDMENYFDYFRRG